MFATIHEALNNLELLKDPSLTMSTCFVGLILIVLLRLGSNVSSFRNLLPSRDSSLSLAELSVRKHTSTLDSSLRESMEWWDSLSPPFHKENNEEEIISVNADTTHFLFLLHGHRGFSRDLSYLQSVMQKFASLEARKTLDENSPGTVRQEMIVHSTTSNERKTTDGIVNGGERVVEEIVGVIRKHMENRQKENAVKNITMSILGNSLGGMYGRYAVSELSERCLQNDGTLVLDDQYRIEMNVFCTTATPHLGVASHTFLPIPRQAEIGVAHAMGETGRDLFRLNNLLKEMATEEKYLGALNRFRKRIAYANAYGTDFPVPAHTAAFLSTTSTYPHHFVDYDNGDDEGLVVASLETLPRLSTSEEYLDGSDDLSIMSMSLDSLGWKKVFVDVRREIPKISLPNVSRYIRRRSVASASDGSDSDENNGSAPINEDVEEERRVEEALHSLRQRGETVSSSDVATAVAAPLFNEKIYWPSGHNMIVAFSRSRLSTYLNKAGRPVVDSLANELVAEIFSWEKEDTE